MTHNTEIRHKPFTKIKVFKQTFVFNFDIDTFAYEWSLKNLNEPLTRIEILWLHKTFSIEIFFTFFLLHIKCLIFPIKTPVLELEMKKVFLSNFSSIFWYLQGTKKVWIGIDSVAFESVAGTQNFNTIHSNALKLDLFKDWINNTNTHIKQTRVIKRIDFILLYVDYNNKHLSLFILIIEQLILKINYIYLPLVLLQHHSFTSFLEKTLQGKVFMYCIKI